MVLLLVQSAAIANESDDVKTLESISSIDPVSEKDAASGDVLEPTAEIPDKTDIAVDPDSNSDASHEALGEKDHSADNAEDGRIAPEEDAPAVDTVPASAIESAGDGAASIIAPTVPGVNEEMIPAAVPATESRATDAASPSAVQERIPAITVIQDSRSVYSSATAGSPAADDGKQESSVGKNREKKPAKAPSPYYNLHPVSRDQYRSASEPR